MSGPFNLVFIGGNRKTLCDLQFFLSRIGYQAHSAREVHQAVELVNTRQPKAVFVEHRPGEHDGLEVCRQLRSDGNLPDVPLTLLTETSPHRLLHHAAAAGVNYVLQLPAAFNDIGVDLYTLVTSTNQEAPEGHLPLRALVRVPRFSPASIEAHTQTVVTNHPWYPVDGTIHSHQVGDTQLEVGLPSAMVDTIPVAETGVLGSETSDARALEMAGVADLLKQMQECFRDTRKRLDAMIQYIDLIAEKDSHPYRR